MLTGALAARNVLGANHDIWNVNIERSYHEEFSGEKQSAASAVALNNLRANPIGEGNRGSQSTSRCHWPR